MDTYIHTYIHIHTFPFAYLRTYLPAFVPTDLSTYLRFHPPLYLHLYSLPVCLSVCSSLLFKVLEFIAILLVKTAYSFSSLCSQSRLLVPVPRLFNPVLVFPLLYIWHLLCYYLFLHTKFFPSIFPLVSSVLSLIHLEISSTVTRYLS
jgi:hypothetical protein